MSELRRDPVTGRWVLVAEWSDPRPLSSSVDPVEETPYAVDSPDPVLERRIPVERERGTIFEKMSGAGQHEIVVEDEGTSRSAADLSEEDLARVLVLWRERMKAFADDRRWRQLAVVKNHGAPAGARLAASHSEIFALPFVPQPIREKMMALLGYYKKNGSCLLCDLVRAERSAKERFLTESLRHAVIAPYASRRPFELMILPKGHHGDFTVEKDGELEDLARLLLTVLRAVREALDDPAYQLLLETAPLDAGADLAQFHWHMTLVPRLPLAEALSGVTDFNPVPPEKAVAALAEVM